MRSWMRMVLAAVTEPGEVSVVAGKPEAPIVFVPHQREVRRMIQVYNWIIR